ncbi:uncharacterized protein LOC125678011 [Ostrea edulis]|uniref:uncharacterized protein LOC125678011 n=1 Tax=Ostrea edulis TaxID=37623 RepID=UPI0024AE9650|nr:uncharacterized protein LOC125678011 [Ostrea edulis]
MFVKFLSIPLLSFGFLEILAFSSSNMASSAYGERGKGGVVRCCEEFVDMPTGIPTATPMGADLSDIQKRSVDSRKPIRPVKTFHELVDSNPCGHNPCHNSGLCEWTPRSSPPFICHCPVGFTGVKCEKDLHGVKAEGGETRPKNGNMSFNDVINLIDNKTATQMLAVFGGTVLGIILIITVHCCRVIRRKQKEDSDYLRRLQSHDVPDTLPPGCCELSNVVFFETLCCLGIIKENIKKEVAEVNVDQLVSDLKLARSLSKSNSKSRDRLIPDEKGSKQSLRSNRSKIPSDHRINQQKRPKSESKTCNFARESHDSYVINVEGNETDTSSTKLNIEYPELRRNSSRSLSRSTEGVDQTVKGMKCSCGKYTTMETSKTRTDSERPYVATSDQIIHAEDILAEKNIRVLSHPNSLVGVQHMSNQHGRPISKLKSESFRSLSSRTQHEDAIQTKGSRQHTSQPTPDIATTDKREYCRVCQRNPSYQSILKTQQRQYVPDISSGRGKRISAQTQTTPTLLSVVERPISPPPPAPTSEPPLSSHSGFARVDKTQNFPSCTWYANPLSAQTQTTPTLLSVVERPISPPPPAPTSEPPLSSHSGFTRVDKTQNFPSCALSTGHFLGFDKSAQTQTTPSLRSVLERPIPPPPPLAPTSEPPLSSHSGFTRVDKTQNFPSCALSTGHFLGFDKSAQTQTTPSLRSVLERPIPPPPPLAPTSEPPLSSHSGFVRKDKSQNFPSCVLNLSPVLGCDKSEFTDVNKKRFSLEDYTADHQRDMQESYSHSPSNAIPNDDVTYLQQNVRQGSNPTVSVPHSTSLRGSERVRRITSDQEERLQGNYIIRPGKSAHYLQDRLQENHSKSSHSENYMKADGKNILSNHKFSNQEYGDDPTNQLSGDEKIWYIENYHPIGTRMHARRSYSQPAVSHKSNDISDRNEIYYNEYYAPKYSEYLNNEAEHVVMPIYKVPTTQSSANSYQTTYREHFGASGVQNIRNRTRSDRQLVDSGIEVNGSRETDYSGERHGHIRSPQPQYQQLRERYERSDYSSDRGRGQRRQYDFESRSSSREGRYDQRPSNNRNLENDQQVLQFLNERGSVSSFVETNRRSPQDARRSRFSKYDQRRRSAPSASFPSDYEEEDLQDDNDVIEYLHQKKTVSGLIENSRQTTPRTVTRRCENRRSNIADNERDRESDEEVLYNLRQRRSVSGRRGTDDRDVRERVMQNVKEDYEDVIPQSLETMSGVNQELKYTKMFATNSTVYPPTAAKIGERKDIRVPIMSKNVFSPPSASRENTQQRHTAENDDPTTRYQDYLRRSMIRWPVRDIDIRRSRDALKGNRLQELLNKDNTSFEQPRDQTHAARTPSRKAYARGHHGNNNNIGSRAYLNDTREETYDYSQNHINRREGIQYNEEPYCDRNETFTGDEKNSFLEQVEQRGNNNRMAYQSRNSRMRERSQTSSERAKDLPWNALQNISQLGNDSSLDNGRLNPKHSTPKASPIDPELHRIWENRNNQESGSLLERLRNSQTIQDKFFSRSDNLENTETGGDVDCDNWNTDAESRVGRRRSRERALHNQQIVYNNQAEHVSRSGNIGNSSAQTLTSLHGVPSASFHNRVSSAFLGPQSLLGDKQEAQRQSFIGCHKSGGNTVYPTGRKRQFPRNSDAINSEESNQRNFPPREY